MTRNQHYSFCSQTLDIHSNNASLKVRQTPCPRYIMIYELQKRKQFNNPRNQSKLRKKQKSAENLGQQTRNRHPKAMIGSQHKTWHGLVFETFFFWVDRSKHKIMQTRQIRDPFFFLYNGMLKMSSLITVQNVSAVHFQTIQLIYNIDP